MEIQITVNTVVVAGTLGAWWLTKIRWRDILEVGNINFFLFSQDVLPTPKFMQTHLDAFQAINVSIGNQEHCECQKPKTE